MDLGSKPTSGSYFIGPHGLGLVSMKLPTDDECCRYRPDRHTCAGIFYGETDDCIPKHEPEDGLGKYYPECCDESNGYFWCDLI